MKLPTENPRSFILDMRQALSGSMSQRAKDSQNWDSLFYTGATLDKENAAIANLITGAIYTQSGNLWSPDRVTWRIEYELDMDDVILQQAARGASFLSRELRDCDADLEVGDAVELALRHGSCGGSLIWDGEEFACDAIPMACFGVLNEKAKSLDEQPAFMVSYSVPIEEMSALIRKFSRTGELARAFDQRDGESAQQMNDATRLILGLNQPIGSASASQAGFINLLPRPPYIPSSNSKGRQVEIDAIWLKQDDGRWATVYVIEGNDTIGTDRWRNFMAVGPDGHEDPVLAKRHPYWWMNPYPVKGSFFGRSSIANIASAQDFVRKHTAGMDHILDMQEDPAYVGFGAINTAELYRQQLRTPGGFLQESGPNAKVQPFVPSLPPELLAIIEAAAGWAEDQSNRPPVAQGRGEKGVRAGAHAETLTINASARERRPANRVVRAAGELGDLALEVARIKDATSLPDGQGGTFTLETLPSGFHVLCNGHTASPLFAAEYNATADELLKAGAIDAEEYLLMKNPAGVDMMVNALKKRQAQQAEILKSLPPEDRVKLIASGGRKR